jgi:peptidylprolyl isomerase
VKALEGITVGSQVIAVMPPDVAYGSAGQGSIPGNATLIFVIDVLGMNK